MDCKHIQYATAVLAALPQYPWYYRRNGHRFYGIDAVLESKYKGMPWKWGQELAFSTTAIMGLGFLRTCNFQQSFYRAMLAQSAVMRQ